LAQGNSDGNKDKTKDKGKPAATDQSGKNKDKKKLIRKKKKELTMTKKYGKEQVIKVVAPKLLKINLQK
jgi:hypothetical protein